MFRRLNAPNEKFDDTSELLLKLGMEITDSFVDMAIKKGHISINSNLSNLDERTSKDIKLLQGAKVTSLGEDYLLDTESNMILFLRELQKGVPKKTNPILPYLSKEQYSYLVRKADRDGYIKANSSLAYISTSDGILIKPSTIVTKEGDDFMTGNKKSNSINQTFYNSTVAQFSGDNNHNVIFSLSAAKDDLTINDIKEFLQKDIAPRDQSEVKELIRECINEPESNRNILEKAEGFLHKYPGLVNVISSVMPLAIKTGKTMLISKLGI